MRPYKNNKTNKWIVIALILFFYVVFTMLFYRQAIEYNDMYSSDLPAHILFAVQEQGYSLLYVMMRALYRLTNSYLAIALLESSFAVLTFGLAARYLEKNCAHNRSVATLISASLLFLCSPYVPVISPYYYTHGLITQPWHNITYIGMRPFALMAFFATVDVLSQYQQKFTWKNWFGIAVPLLISAGIKPNFLITYCFALLFVLVFDFVRDLQKARLDISRFKNYISLGSVVFPSIVVLLTQSFVLYGSASETGEASGIAVVFASSSFFSDGIISTLVKLVRDMAFPILIWLYAGKTFSRADRFAYLQFLITLIQVIILKETGPRELHGNFYWGLIMSGYILYLFSVSRFAQIVFVKKGDNANMQRMIFVCLGVGLFIWHILSGLVYFVIVLKGNNFYC